MAGKLISDLNSGTLSLADEMEIDKDVSGTRTSYKTTVKDIVDFANRNVAEEYDSTSTYAVDDYVIYESVLYKCIGTTTGTFDSTKWTSVVVTDEMGSGGGGGTGGHTIIDENGNSMTARAGLQFFGAVGVRDDNANNRTLVEVLGGDFYNPIIYSTTEREIGVWTDGKPLYQKTVYLASVTTGTGYAHNIQNVENIFIYSIKAKRNTGGWFTSGHIFTDTQTLTSESFSVIPSLTTLYTYLFGCTITECYITVQYTKTTDTAGSGSWTPQGVPTHHYSTDEQVIGTWIDGKTLYEKTYTGLDVNVAYNSWTNVVEVASDMDVLVGVEILSSNTEKHNITGSGIEYYLDKSAHYIKAEYNQNVNRRNIGTITIRYTKTS